MVEGVSRQCEALYLRDCDLAEMRLKVGSDSMCPGDDSSGCSSSDGYCIDPTCRDDPTYVDEAGYLCDQWVGDNCDDAFPGWASSGYTQAGEDELLAKCRYSCGRCPRLQTPEACDAATCGGVSRAELMTREGGMLVSANFGRLVLGCIEADLCE